MPKIKMLKSNHGQDVSESGTALPVKLYEAGKEYDVGQSLAKTFCVDMKIAEMAKDKPAKAANKKGAGAPENKGAKDNAES